MESFRSGSDETGELLSGLVGHPDAPADERVDLTIRKPLADEPTGALDPDTGGTVMNLLEEVARESEAALIVIREFNIADRAVAARFAMEGMHLDRYVENALERWIYEKYVIREALARPLHGRRY